MLPLRPKKCVVQLPPPILSRIGPILNAKVTLPESTAKLRGTRPEVSVHTLIDTGATFTSISAEVATQLQLSPVLRGNFVGAHGKPEIRNIYVVDFTFEGSGFYIRNVRVAEVDLAASQIQMLIGRDVLSLARFTYDGPAGEFTLEIPSPSHPRYPRTTQPQPKSPLPNRKERRRLEALARRKK